MRPFAVPFALILLATLAAAPATSTAAPAPAVVGVAPAVPPDVDYPVRLSIGPDGAVQSVDSGDAIPDMLRALVHRAAARARFEPARRGGTAVASRAWATARVGFEPAGARVRARVVGLVSGGGVRPAKPRSSPMRTRARGFSADVMVRVVFGPDGRLDEDASRVERVAVRRDPGVEPYPMLESALGKRFGNGVERSFGDWRWVPDEIDGQPIGGEFRMPVGFPSARASRAGQVLAPDAPAAVYVPRPPAGLVAPRLLAWEPLAAAGGD
jgi:hypothetical protein